MALRGTDIIGQALMNALNDLGSGAASSIVKNRQDTEQNNILGQLLNQQTPQNIQYTGQAPQGQITPGQPINMGVQDTGSRSVPMFSQQNIPLLRKLDPTTLQLALEMQPKVKGFAPGSLIGQEDLNGNFNPIGQAQFKPSATDPNHQIVKSNAIAPDGKTHVFADTIDKTTGKVVNRTDLGEAPPSGKASGMAGVADEAMKMMDPATMEFNYQQFKTDGVPPKITGMAGVLPTVKLLQYYAKRANEEGIPGAAFAAQKALYSTAKGGLGAVQKLASTAKPFVQSTKDFLGRVEDQLDHGYRPPTDSPVANEFAQWLHGEKITGDPQYSKFKTYIYAAVRDYAKVTTGSHGSVAGLSDFATQGAESILNAMQSPEAIRSVMQAMKTDVEIIQKNYDNTVSDLRKSMQTSVQPSGGPKPVATQSANQTFVVNGKTYSVPSDKVDEFKKDMGIK